MKIVIRRLQTAPHAPNEPLVTRARLIKLQEMQTSTFKLLRQNASTMNPSSKQEKEY